MSVYECTDLWPGFDHLLDEYPSCSNLGQAGNCSADQEVEILMWWRVWLPGQLPQGWAEETPHPHWVPCDSGARNWKVNTVICRSIWIWILILEIIIMRSKTIKCKSIQFKYDYNSNTMYDNFKNLYLVSRKVPVVYMSGICNNM